MVIIDDDEDDTPPQSSFTRALLEVFWIVTLLIYESFCFLLLSGLAIVGSGLLNDGATTSPAFQTVCAILLLLIFTILFEQLEILIIRPFINRLKTQHSIVLASTPELLSVAGAFYFSWDILNQFYNRYEILMHFPETSTTMEASGPVKCVSNLGLHFLGKLQEECHSYIINMTENYVPKLAPLEDAVLLESSNSARFILGVLNLTYFLYKRSLKRVPLSALPFSDYTLTHLKSNGILVIIVFASVGAFDVWNVKSIQRDWFIFILLVILVRIAELLPWYRILGVEEVPGRDFQIMKAYSFWIHSIFYFLSLFGMCYIFFKVHPTGKDSLLYFYERKEEESDSNNDNAKFGVYFATPDKLAAAAAAKKELQYSVNVNVLTFRGLITMMLISGTRCVEGYLKMEKIV